MRTPLAWGLAALALGFSLAGCGDRRLAVDQAWVRLAALPGRPAAAYFTLRGGATPDDLVAVSSDGARKAEMHETMTESGAGTGDRTGGGAMSMMTPLARVAVPAGATVAFQPGGRHVMLFDVANRVRPGGEMTLTLAFVHHPPLTERAIVIGAGDPAPQ